MTQPTGIRMHPKRIMRIASVLLALFFPVLLYLFLRSCAYNSFEVPFYHQSPTQPITRIGCDSASYPIQYPYSIWANMEDFSKWINYNADFHLFTYGDQSAILNIAQHIPEDFSIQMYHLGPEPTLPPAKPWMDMRLAPMQLQILTECILLVHHIIPEHADTQWAVLVDLNGYIRSYTNPNTQEGQQQIRAEIQILANYEPME